MDGFQLLRSPLSFSQGRFRFHDLDLQQLCETYETPFYLYDVDFMLERYNELKSFFTWPRTTMYYAMKANYNLDLLKAVNAINGRVEAVSPAELLLLKKLGFTNDRILYTANNMPDEEIRFVHATGVLLNLDSLSALRRYGEIAPGSDVCLRFNSDVVAGEHWKIQTGGDKTKFGLLLEDAQLIKEIVDRYRFNVVGLHEHTGSGIADAEKVCQGMRNLLSLDAKNLFPNLRFVDFGGGFKVAYKPDEKRIDYPNLGAKMSSIFADFCASYGRDLDLYFEPGKYVVAECGALVVRVNTIKNNRGRLIAGMDSGFPQLIRPIFYDAYHHIVNVTNPSGKPQTYDICGNICETGDLFASDRNLPEIREGDYLAVMNAGAYGFAMASIYNVRPLPAEVVVQDGKARLSRPKLSHAALAEEIFACYAPSP